MQKGQAVQDTQNSTGRTGHAEQDTKIGLPERDRQNRTVGTGQAEQYR
jgi:hypothetical protein